MITKEQFLKYEEIRNEGNYNMIMDAYIVMQITGLTKDEYFDIIKNYSEYYKKYCQ